MPRSAGRLALIAAVVVLAGSLAVPAAGAQECTPGENGCLPTPEQCATGEHNGVALGEAFLSASVCAGAGGTTIAYTGGQPNPLAICGAVVVAGQVLADADPNACADVDGLLPPRVPYRVVLPADYRTSNRRYPVLYLLAGGGHDQNAWLTYDPADPKLLQKLANRGVIIVSVFTGITFHTNWRDGTGNYESMFVDQVIPAVDRTYRTVARRSGRAIAGFSMGGYGALALAAHHPDLFAAIGSFSGVADTTQVAEEVNWYVGPASLGTWQAPVGPTPWGDPVTNELWWRDANPVDLVHSFGGTSIWLSTGDGTPTEENLATDGPFVVLGAQAEAAIHQTNETLHSALEGAGIPHDYRVHPGTHSTVAAAQDLRDWFPTLLKALGRRDPATFHLDRAVPVFGAFGWTFRADPERAPEVLQVVRASRRGVSFHGSGRTRVTTPAWFRPGTRVRVSDEMGAEPLIVTAGRTGRLAFTVDLGPPHAYQQYTAPALAAQSTPLGPYWGIAILTFRTL
jgi:S-formylglutathione hydrolase FrmB